MALRFDVAKAEVAEGAVEGLTIATEVVLTESNTLVPHQEGNLERSGETRVDAATLTGSIFYDTPYAVVQHEDTSLRHDVGRSDKYLERALNSTRDTVAAVIAQAIRTKLGG